MNSIASGHFFDPALTWTLRIFLAIVFARALLGKLREPRRFVDALRGYQLLPEVAVGPAAVLLLVCEGGLVPALLHPRTGALSAAVAGLLLLLYAGAIAINLSRGRHDIDCGCGGPLRRQPLHPLLVLRNLLFTGMAMLATLAPLGRPLIGFDAFTISFAVFALVALAVALDGLAALAPGIERLRASS